jgi:hypothetical protein
MGTAVEVALNSLEATYDRAEPRGVEQRYVAWACGSVSDEGMGFAVGGAGWQCSDSIAPDLYEVHMTAATKQRAKIQQWAFEMAASYALSARMRYRLEWGRQAALDGLVLGLMNRDDSRDELFLLTNEERAEQFGVGRNRYARVRGHVRDLVRALLSEFEGFMRKGLD